MQPGSAGSSAAGPVAVLDDGRQLQPSRADPPIRRAFRRSGPLVVASLGAAALANVGVLAIPNLAWAAAAALVLVALVPGGLLAKLIAPADAAAPAETVLIGIGLGGAALSVSGLLLNYLPVQLGRGLLLAWFDGLALVLVALVLARGLRTTDGAGDRRPWSAVSRQTYGLLLVVALAAALRLPTLGYSEFQGDETEVVLRAVGVAEDVPDALYYHAKGPAEVLVTAVVYGLIGGISEASARLPFALASVAGIATCYLFGRRLLGPVGGLTAALLLAFDGYLVAFARIAQYQSVVFLMSALGVLCAVRWAAGSGQKDVGGERAALAAESGTVRWPVLAGAFVATGALAHYDAVWALPPIGLIAVWGRGGWRGLLERKAPVRVGHLSFVRRAAGRHGPGLDGQEAGKHIAAVGCRPGLVRAPVHVLRVCRQEARDSHPCGGDAASPAQRLDGGPSMGSMLGAQAACGYRGWPGRGVGPSGSIPCAGLPGDDAGAGAW